MDTKDQGHRFGNFPNYYAFHPPANRLEVLEKTNILSYIRQRLLFLDGVDKDNDDCDGTLAAAIANKEGKVSNKVEPATKKLRIEEKTRLSARLNAKVHGDGTIIYYCDLGCNEGDLTLAMAASLTRKCTVSNKAIDESKGKASENENKDGSKVQEEVAIKCLGLDLDPMLINRANTKCSSSSKVDNSKQEESISNNIAAIDATFKVCNLCSESEHNSACNSFLLHHKILPTDTTGADETKNKQSTSHLPVPIFHLTSIFSTTMWIHVHAGDEGLKSFVERACSWTKQFLLIEPQPSAW